MPPRHTSHGDVVARRPARHRRPSGGLSGKLRKHVPAATAVVAGLTGIAVVTALLSGPVQSARADSQVTTAGVTRGVGDFAATAFAVTKADLTGSDRSQALRQHEILAVQARQRATNAALQRAATSQFTRNKVLAARAKQRDRQAALAWARGRTDAQARVAAQAWARSFRAAGGHADQEAQAARILAHLPASASRLDAASMLKNTDHIGRRDGEWDHADRTVVKGTARAAAVMLLDDYGFDLTQWSCLDRMWWQESNWRWNSQSGQTYGIAQALPGSKMASAGADWATNPVTQIKWGLGYVKARYGSPCDAWRFWSAHHWY